MVFGANIYPVDENATQEECEKRNSVLSHGVRSVRNGYEDIARLSGRDELTVSRCAGRTTFVNTLCGKQVLDGKDAEDFTNAHLEESVKINQMTTGPLF